MKRIKLLILSGLVCLVAGAAVAANEVVCSQQVTLQPGWNAFYLTVSPEAEPGDLFASWPVERVGWYDPAAFLATKQFSPDGTTEGTVGSGHLVWRRGDEALSTLKWVRGNGVYTCFVTNNQEFVYAFYGAPVAPRMTWHPSSTNETMNYAGFSLEPGASVTCTEYFDGFADYDPRVPRKYYRFYGVDPAKVSLGAVASGDTFKNGEVVVVTSARASDWSGVLYVTPAEGLDFGLYGQQAHLTVRNDSTVARNVRLTFRRGEAKPFAGEPPTVPEGLHFRDNAGAVTNEPWQVVADGMVIDRALAASETWDLVFALDRRSFNAPSGTVYGVVAEFVDTGASHARAAVPITVTDGGAQGRGNWPEGMWVASAALDTVTHIGETAKIGGVQTHEVPAGGTMKVRLPVYVDKNGKLTLVQRYWYGLDTNGVTIIRKGATKPSDVGVTNFRRVSSPFLPTDQPEIAFEESSVFDASATVKFTVGERSNVNPMRHAQHPSHDGLTSDYKGYTPSGDNISNYVTSTVKPETFSIENAIRFDWKDRTGEAWMPEETLSGTLTWEFGGIRHAEGEQDGKVRAKGAFKMTRVWAGEVK